MSTHFGDARQIEVPYNYLQTMGSSFDQYGAVNPAAFIKIHVIEIEDRNNVNSGALKYKRKKKKQQKEK